MMHTRPTILLKSASSAISFTLLAGGSLLAAAIGLASPASAEPPTGSFNAVLSWSPSGENGHASGVWTLTSCGPTCVHVQTSGTTAYDLHQQGDTTWTGTSTAVPGSPCTETLQTDSMSISTVCAGGISQPVYHVLTRVG